MSSGIDKLIEALPRVSNQQLEAWFTVVVKTKADLMEAKRFLHGPPHAFPQVASGGNPGKRTATQPDKINELASLR